MNALATTPALATAQPTRSILATSKGADCGQVVGPIGGTLREKLVPVPHDRGWEMGRETKQALPFTAEQLGPRTVGAVLDRAFEVLRLHFGILMIAGLVLFIPARILFFFQIRPAFNGEFLGQRLEVGLTLMLANLIGALAARLFGAYLSDDKVSVSRIFNLGPSEFFGLLLLSLVSGLLASLGVCFFLVGTLLVVWLVALAPVVYVLETDRPPMARIHHSLRRSFSLVTGSFWRWLGLVSILGILGIALQGPFVWFDDAAKRASLSMDLGLQQSSVDLAVCLLGSISSALTAALSGVVYASFYFDQRSRLEGVDLYVALRKCQERCSGAG